VLLCGLLCWLYLRESRTIGTNSDAAAQVLQGWDMLHGNPLLRGWFLSDVSFYTFEVPLDGLIALAHGLGPDTAHVTAAVVDHHRRALRREIARVRAAEPAPCSCDNRHPAC